MSSSSLHRLRRLATWVFLELILAAAVMAFSVWADTSGASGNETWRLLLWLRDVQDIGGLLEDVRIAEICFAVVGGNLREAPSEFSGGDPGRRTAPAETRALRAGCELVFHGFWSAPLPARPRAWRESQESQRPLDCSGSDVAVELRKRGRLQKLLHARHDFVKTGKNNPTRFSITHSVL